MAVDYGAFHGACPNEGSGVGGDGDDAGDVDEDDKDDNNDNNGNDNIEWQLLRQW